MCFDSERRMAVSCVPCTRSGVCDAITICAALATVGSSCSAQAVASDGLRRTPCADSLQRPVAILEGMRIGRLDIQARGPRPLPLIGAPLHVTTRASIVQSRLLFGVGDLIDTLRVNESLRQLRRLPSLSGAAIAASCDDSGGVRITVTTIDVWSMRPRVSNSVTSGAVAGLEEINMFGMARTGSLYVRSYRGQLGVGVAYRDPTLIGGRVTGTASHDVFRNGAAWSAAVRSTAHGVYDRWGVLLAAQLSTRQSSAQAGSVAAGDTVHRTRAIALITHRVTSEEAGATFVLAGAQYERTAITAGESAALVGPSTVRRRYAGADLGIMRRSGDFSIVPWLLPRAADGGASLAPAELPAGSEGEVLFSVGRDVAAHRPASSVVAGGGRIWRLGARMSDSGHTIAPRALVSTDIWARGYRLLGTGSGEWNAATLRGAALFVAPAGRGLWSVAVAVEQLTNPDPDVRVLTLLDPLLLAIPARSRLAEQAVSVSAERTSPLLRAHRGYSVDGAVFVAGSARWDGAVMQSFTPKNHVPSNRSHAGLVMTEHTGKVSQQR